MLNEISIINGVASVTNLLMNIKLLNNQTNGLFTCALTQIINLQ